MNRKRSPDRRGLLVSQFSRRGLPDALGAQTRRSRRGRIAHPGWRSLSIPVNYRRPAPQVGRRPDERYASAPPPPQPTLYTATRSTAVRSIHPQAIPPYPYIVAPTSWPCEGCANRQSCRWASSPASRGRPCRSADGDDSHAYPGPPCGCGPGCRRVKGDCHERRPLLRRWHRR